MIKTISLPIILTGLILAFAPINTVHASNAQKKPSKSIEITAIKAVQKKSRDEMLIAKKLIDDSYNVSLKSAKNELQTDLNLAKKIKGKSKTQAIMKAHSKYETSIKTAKEVKKEKIKLLTGK